MAVASAGGAGPERVMASPRVVAAAVDWDAVATWLTWAAFAVIVALGLVAPIRRTGDAHQYYAMAGALAALRPPALTASEVAAYKGWLRDQPPDSGFPGSARAVEQPVLVVGDRQEFSHFWFYPLLAAPFVAAVQALGLHPGYGFLLANATLLGLAIGVVQRHCRPVIALLLLASPIVWFVDKAQVELFTFALLCVAMAEARRGRFLVAALAAAVASTQNLPILLTVPIFWAAGLVGYLRAVRPPIRLPGIWRGRWLPSPAHGPGTLWVAVGGDGRPRAGGAGQLVAATVVVGALHPAYYLWRVGVLTPQQLNGGIAAGFPSPERYLAVLVDPDLGLLPWMPLFGLLVGLGLVLLLRSGALGPGTDPGLRLAAACGLVCGAWFLFVFAQTSNVNSGGTVYVSRYALWLIPLALPLLEAAALWLGPRLPYLLPALALASFGLYAWYFQPSQPERYVDPSPQSRLVDAWLPGVYRPVPEVFYERQLGVDGGVRGSAADAACRVILLDAGSPEMGCDLARGERDAADALFAAGWRAVWIVRPGPVGLGAGVYGALRK